MSIIHDFKDIAKRVKTADHSTEQKEVECQLCFDSGHEMYSTGHMDPHFRTCPRCNNPKGNPCP
jgi:hypothetical protein